MVSPVYTSPKSKLVNGVTVFGAGADGRAPVVIRANIVDGSTLELARAQAQIARILTLMVV